MKLSSVIIYLSLLYVVFVLSQIFPTDLTGMIILSGEPVESNFSPLLTILFSLLITTVSATYLLTRKPATKHVPLLHTITQHSDYGFGAAHTKEYLLSKGYKVKELNIVDVFYYIKNELKRGIPASTVKHNCVREGWRPSEVDSIIGHFLRRK